MKTTVIYHSADFDGIFCREIARKFLPDADLIGWDHGDKPLPIPPDGEIYILDLPVDRVFGFDFKNMGAADVLDETLSISQPGSQIRTFLESCKRVVWIDHHKSSIDSHPKDIPGYRIDGVAACRLAWQWFAVPLQERDEVIPLPTKQDFIDHEVSEPLAVRLAGEYDIWDKRDPRTDAFQFGLRSVDLTPHGWSELLHPNREENIFVDELLNNGALLQRYQQQQDSSLVQHRSYLMHFEGLTFLTLNTARCNSMTFAAKDVPETGHDALCGYFWNGSKWRISLYHAKHRMDIDLSQIAVKHGGGGHRGACGFEREDGDWL